MPKRILKYLVLALSVLMALGIVVVSYADTNMVNISEVLDDCQEYTGTNVFVNDTGETAYIYRVDNNIQILDESTHASSGEYLQPDMSLIKTLLAGETQELTNVTVLNNCLYNHKAPQGSPNNTSSAPAHTHDFITGTIYEATCDHDGLEGTYCKTCGYVLNSSPISAFGYALYTDATQKITAAKSGQKIVLEFKELNSFPKAFMEKIAARVTEGVSFEFRYNVNHELQKITIPAYSTVDTSLDWYGYAKMAELYGMN